MSGDWLRRTVVVVQAAYCLYGGRWPRSFFCGFCPSEGFAPAPFPGVTTDKDETYCVRTATLVAPTVAPPAVLNRTNARLTPGLKATFPVPRTKTAKVGVCPASICTVALGPGVAGFIHAP